MLLAFFGVHANAQVSIMLGGENVPVVHEQTVEVKDAAGSSYSGRTATFDAAAVATELGLSSIADADQYILNPSNLEAVVNSSDGWRNGAGDLCGWNDITEETRGYCVKIEEPETGLVNYLGAHHNGVWNEGDVFTGYWTFVSNGMAAVVKVVVTFVDPSELGEEPGGDDEPGDDEPTVELPTPETIIANLQIVGKAEVSNERYYTQGYETSSLALALPTMAEALGISKEDLAKAFSRMVYVDQYSEGTNTGVMNLLTVTDGWMRTFIDSETDEMTGEMVGALFGSEDDVFVQRMAYNAETDSVTFVMGQMPGGLELGDKRFVNLYVVYGQKAFVIKYSVSFVEPPFNGLEDMTKVGEQTIEVSQQPTNDYSFVTFSLDLETISSLLGCDVTDVQMQGLGANGGLSTDHTANNGGWWLTADGAVTNWGGTASFFVEPASSNTWTDFHVGQYPDVNHAGDVVSAKLYLTYQGKYYEVTVKFTIEQKQEVVDPEMRHIVAERTITVAQELNDAYAWSEGVMIPNEYLIETIGTTDVHLYALDLESTEEEPIYTDEYSCDPKPGFWVLSDGRKTTWGNSSVWGMSIAHQTSAEGVVFNCIQFPGLTNIGDSFTGKFFLANAENGAMLQVNVIYNIVENMEQSNIVGTENLKLKLSADENSETLDLNKIAEALGFENEDEMLNEGCLRAMTANGVYGDFVKPTDGVTLDDNGYVVEDGNVGIYFDAGAIFTFCNAEQVPTEWKANATLCFEKDDQRYVLNIAIYSEDIYEKGDTPTDPVDPELPDDGSAILAAGIVVPVIDVQLVEAVDTVGVTYSGMMAEFDVDAVVEALGIESIDEAKQYIVNPTTWKAVNNTTDGWRNGAGDATGWGDITEEGRGYCVKIDDPASGWVDYLGAHHNGVWNKDDVFTAYWAFVAGQKAVLVKVVVTFVEAEPDPTAISGLSTAAKTATYDLQGRLVKKAQKGIFIQNGVKVIK